MSHIHFPFYGHVISVPHLIIYDDDDDGDKMNK